MEKKQKILEAIQNMPETHRMLGKESINALPDVVQADEGIKKIVLGSQEEHYYLLVATTKRVIYFSKDASDNANYRSFNYEDVKEIEMLDDTNRVKLITANSANTYHLIESESAAPFVKVVKDAMSQELNNRATESGKSNQKTVIEKNDFISKALKYKWILIAVAALIILLIGQSMGKSFAKVPLNDGKANLNKIESLISEKEKELAVIEGEIEAKQEENKALDDEKVALEDEKKSVLDEISKHQTEFDEAMEISKNKDSLLAEIKSIEGEISTKTGKLEGLENNIANKQDELATVDQLIKEKEDDPISLSAGTYIIGIDLPPGRYKAMPVGRGSNFATYDANGRLDVNTILGSNGEAEYIFFAQDGGIIESRSTAKLVPVE